MQNLLVLKDTLYQGKRGGGTIAGLHELNLLLPGGCVITADETIVTAATTVGNLEGKESFAIYVGVDTADTSLSNQYATLKSPLISRSAFSRYKRAYAAPTAKVITVGETGTNGLNLPGTLTVGSVATLRIIRNVIAPGSPLNSRMFHTANANDSISIEYRVKSNDDEADIVAGLVAAVNAHPNNQGANSWIVAAAVGTPNDAFTLTGDLFQNFYVAVDDLLVNAVVATTTPIGEGNGHWSQIAELENNYAPVMGDTNWRTNPSGWKIPRQTVAGATYVTYSFGWNTQSRQAVGSNGDTWDHDFILAVPSGATTLITALDTIFGVLFLDTTVFGSGIDNI